MTSASKDDRRSTTRFEATLHRGKRHVELEDLPALDLDRLPDPDGEVRVLLSAEDAARIVELGFEVRLVEAVPVKPLDAALTADDDEMVAELERRLESAREKGGQ